MQGEELFLVLQQEPSDLPVEVRNGLVASGYLTEEGDKTGQAVDFIQRFIDEREETVYRSIIDSADDVEAFFKLREAGVFKQHPTFLVMVRHLGDQGKILKKN